MNIGRYRIIVVYNLGKIVAPERNRLAAPNMAYEGYKDKEKRKAYRREWMRNYMRELRESHKQQGTKYRWNSSEYGQKLRLKAMGCIGGSICASCGCDDLRILEINHINGGGNKSMKDRSNTKQLYRKIIKHVNPTSEYNVLCRPCNALHYVQEILKISGHKISWSKPLV